MIWKLFLGFIFGILVGALSWRAGALTRNGALAASLTGGLIFGLGGFPWAALLLAFFVSSSGLSRAFRKQKLTLAAKFDKGARRDWGQVLANGGLGALLSLVQSLNPAIQWAWVAYSGAMAAVNADTWATELGVVSPSPPRLLVNGKVVERGTSGGVTPLGVLASVAGGSLIGLLAGLFTPTRLTQLLGITTAAGLLGSLFDSLLGATVQGIYFCPTCEKETERHPTHTCSTLTIHQRGWKWLNNDLVNAAASILGAGAALVGWTLLEWM